MANYGLLTVHCTPSMSAADPAAAATACEGAGSALPCATMNDRRGAAAPTPAAPLRYRDAGVDIDAGDEVVERIKPHARRTMRPEVLSGIGGFAALCRAALEGTGVELRVEADPIVPPASIDEQLARFEDVLKEEDWGHQPC